MKKRIWFNRWFRTGIDFIDLIREGDTRNEYEIYITHHQKSKEFIKRADHFELDKHFRGEKYVDFCIDFCKRHSIDIFIPKYCLHDISKYEERFADIGTKVLLSAGKRVMKLVQNKVKFYEDCRVHNIVTIPDYHNVTTWQQFEACYKELRGKGETVCYKMAVSEGGLDFRIIDEGIETGTTLHPEIDPKHRISYKEAYSIFKKMGTFAPVMVMEYLDDTEYSIDCLAYKGKLLAAIPRKKVEWYRILEEKKELFDIAEKMAKIYNFSYIFNVQVKYKDGVPKLLEVNPRMSAGLNTSCRSGINFPYLALELMAGREVTIPKLQFGIVVNHAKEDSWVSGLIEKPIITKSSGSIRKINKYYFEKK